MKKELILSTLLAAGFQAVLANPTTLVCNLDGQRSGFYIEDEATTIDLDEERGTVQTHFGKRHIDTGVGYPQYSPARRSALMQASFGANSITFSDGSFGTYADFVINRITGKLQWVGPNWSWSCQAAKKQF